MGESSSLKDQNRLALSTYVFLHVAVAVWVVLGLPVTLDNLLGVLKAEWSKAGLALVVALFCAMFNRLAGTNTKMALIYWSGPSGWTGARAFSEIAPNDPKIDIERLRNACGGFFPTAALEQNALFYRLYQQQRSNPSVLNPHKEFLLFRDLTWLTVLLTVLITPLLWLAGHPKVAAYYAGVCCLMYFLFRLAARTSSRSFVSSVLACAAADEGGSRESKLLK